MKLFDTILETAIPRLISKLSFKDMDMLLKDRIMLEIAKEYSMLGS